MKKITVNDFKENLREQIKSEHTKGRESDPSLYDDEFLESELKEVDEIETTDHIIEYIDNPDRTSSWDVTSMLQMLIDLTIEEE